MQRSTDRILTTHAGSLPRPQGLIEMMVQRSRREALDEATFAATIEASTSEVIARQIEAGIDIGNNGEHPRESFFTYVQHRLSGFGDIGPRPIMRDITHFPTFLAQKMPDFARTMVSLVQTPKAIGAVRYADRTPVERECADFLRLHASHTKGFAETFMSAASPGIVAAAMANVHYANYREYVLALSDALKTEYNYVVAQGLILQLDCPDLAMERHTLFADRSVGEFLDFVDINIAAINRALADVPRDRVRLHVCWGNYEAPHVFDVPLEEILPRLYQANVGALMIALANPRHAHEYKCFARAPLPKDMLLIAGVIDTTTNYVEHPEVVAERLERVAQAVGDPHRILAGTDCGFDTAAGLGDVAGEVVWEKLRALRAGADLASKRLL
jgi:5-methyltetrahydropteroyltriglutamate--homocysteine methyltransferase